MSSNLTKTVVTINEYALSDENANNALIALCALVTVLMVHDVMESVLVRTRAGKIAVESILAFVILRAHGSFSQTLKCVREIRAGQGLYVPYRDCHHWEQDTLEGRSIESICSSCQEKRKNLRLLLAQTFVLRVLILAVEVAVIMLALNRKSHTPVANGKYAVTPCSNNFGSVVAGSSSPVSQIPGCVKLLSSSSRHNVAVNRMAQLIWCTRLHQPIQRNCENVPKRNDSFSLYYLYLDLSGDKVTLADANREEQGAEVYSYWQLQGDQGDKFTPEAVVATVVSGKNYAITRKAVNADTGKGSKMWKKKIDAQMHNKLGSAYETAYKPSTWDTADEGDPVPRMQLLLNIKELPKRYNVTQKSGEAIAHVLNDLVCLQKAKYKSPRIWHSDGVKMKETKEVIEYIISTPILGVISWGIVVFLTWSLRGLYFCVFPNMFFPRLLEMYKKMPETHEDSESSSRSSSW